ncbi:MAG: PepSY domain-containing protein [Rhodocyclaceae bacterium]|nr:PepSY domain-containing protein [Rhodocyclaceae bacterium]
MKHHFRQSMAWLHTWGTLVVGWLLFFIFVFGAATMFHFEVTRWMQPERSLSVPTGQVPRETMVAHALDHLERHAAGATRWQILLPHERHRGRQERRSIPGVGWQGSGYGHSSLDPATGAVIPEPEARATHGGGAFLHLHSELYYLSEAAGIRIVAACAMLGLLGLVTGVIVHKRIFKDFFTFRRGKGRRSWLDAHNVAGVMALPFFVMIIYSGLVYFDRESLPLPVAVVYGTGEDAVKRYYGELTGRNRTLLPVQRPAASIAAMIDKAEQTLGKNEIGEISITHPAGGVLQIELRRPHGSELPRYENPETTFRFDATTGAPIEVEAYGPGIKFRWFMLTLHDGWFATAGLLWLYVISALLGCVMIATGMVLWVVKRRERHAREGSAAGFGLSLVARLNIGVFAGLPVGVAAYFWANRLLPVSLVDRADWELNCLFAVWGWLILYAALRPEKRAWVETLWLATAAFGLIPLLNALTTERHLGVTLPAGDWGLAGVDLTMFGLAAVFGVMAWRLWRRWRSVAGVPA